MEGAPTRAMNVLPGVTIRKALTVGTYDGVSEDWTEFEQRFDIASQFNRWSPEDRGLQLAACLVGSAKLVIRGLTGEECRDFERISGRLKAKFITSQHSERSRRELERLTRKAETPLAEYADKLRT